MSDTNVTPPTVRIEGTDLTYRVTRYVVNGRPALWLYELDGQPWGHVSVNLTEVDIAPDCVCIRLTAPYEAVLPALVAAGWVRPTGDLVLYGIASMAAVCRLLVPMMDDES